MRGRILGDTLSAGQVSLALIAGLGVDAVQRQARRVELGIGHGSSPASIVSPGNYLFKFPAAGADKVLKDKICSWRPCETSEARLNRFNRLMQELIRGNMNRNTFQPWEIEILLDIEACQIREPVKRETLRRYQKAVQRAMEKGAPTPLAPLRVSERKERRGSPQPHSPQIR